jgi:hypothetical protein
MPPLSQPLVLTEEIFACTRTSVCWQQNMMIFSLDQKVVFKINAFSDREPLGELAFA